MPPQPHLRQHQRRDIVSSSKGENAMTKIVSTSMKWSLLPGVRKIPKDEESLGTVTFPVICLKVVLPRLPPLQSTVVAPQTKHLEDVQRVRMASEALPFVVPLPDCPRVQAAFCAGILHPEGADRVIPMPSIKYGQRCPLWPKFPSRKPR